MKRNRRPSYLSFEKRNYQWRADIDYAKHPTFYRVGRGEQGVLICEPYKSTLISLWRFKSPALATKSSRALFTCFKKYLYEGDFVGADMARKFLQMGFTRARRYANYRGGIKYDKDNNYALNIKGTGSPEKAEGARIFYDAWQRAEAFSGYAKLKREWLHRYG